VRVESKSTPMRLPPSPGPAIVHKRSARRWPSGPTPLPLPSGWLGKERTQHGGSWEWPRGSMHAHGSLLLGQSLEPGRVALGLCRLQVKVLLVGKTKAAIHGDGVLHLLQPNAEDGGKLCHGGVFVQGHKNLVQQVLQVISQDAVHNKAFQRRDLGQVRAVQRAKPRAQGQHRRRVYAVTRMVSSSSMGTS
jgi:hypothetical protein